MALPDDIYLNQQQLNVFFQSLTLSMLKLAPNAYSSVRIGWLIGGAPAWGINEDVTSIRIIGADNPYNRQREVKQLPNDELNCNLQTTYTRVLRVFWTLYGPNSYDRTQDIRDQLFYPLIHSALAVQNLYLIPNIVEPVRAPEYFQGQWWQRADFYSDFNEKIVRNLSVPYIQSAEIGISSDSPPDNQDADVTETTIVRS